MKNPTEVNELNEDNSVLVTMEARVPLKEGFNAEELIGRLDDAIDGAIDDGSEWMIGVVEKVDDDAPVSEDFVSSEIDESVHVRELWAAVLNITYDFVTKELIIYQPEYSCVDMGGAIKFAQRIDPRVQQIQTMAGNKVDTTYVLTPNGEWEVQMPLNFSSKG